MSGLTHRLGRAPCSGWPGCPAARRTGWFVTTVTQAAGQPGQQYRQGVLSDAFEIVAGRHRWEAARKLRWKEIDVVVMDDDAATCRMWEISENLHRAELKALERSELVKEWVELVKGKVRQVDAPLVGGCQPKEQGVRKAARELGLSEPAVRRAIKTASLSPEAKQVAREVGLDDNKAALLEAARKEDPVEQVEALKSRAGRKSKSDILADQKRAWMNAMFRLWDRAGSEWKVDFQSAQHAPIGNPRLGTAK